MKTFLETERLILRLTDPSDLEDLVALRSNPEVMKYIGQGRTQTREEVERFIKIAVKYQEKHNHGFCSVFEKSSGAFIGQAGLFHLSFDDREPEIEGAYRLHPQYWGKGYATELTRALIQWGFEHLPISHLIAGAHPENIRSQRVLEKAGMAHYGRKIDFRGIGILLPGYEIYKSDSIEIVPYDPNWPALAKVEIEILKKVLPRNHIIDIQHVGSTAIPDMPSKPIIDIQIAVDFLDEIKTEAIAKLTELNYIYWDKNPDKERMLFIKGMPPFGEKRTHHVHIVEPTSRHWREKLAFRDYLLSHDEARKEYQNLKLKLAELYKYDRERYTEAKTLFIKSILERVNKY